MKLGIRIRNIWGKPRDVIAFTNFMHIRKNNLDGYKTFIDEDGKIGYWFIDGSLPDEIFNYCQNVLDSINLVANWADLDNPGQNTGAISIEEGKLNRFIPDDFSDEAMNIFSNVSLNPEQDLWPGLC